MKRRRHGLPFILTVTAWIVLPLLLGLALWELLFTPAGPAFSEKENRMLAERPALSGETLLDGSFTGGVESFLADRFPGRDGVITFTQDLRQIGSIASWDDYARVADDRPVQVMENVEILPVSEAPITPRPPPVSVSSGKRDASVRASSAVTASRFARCPKRSRSL